jgi:hypothetical protein
MTKLILLAFLFSSSLYAQSELPPMTTEASVESKEFNPRKSHWITTFGFETLNYEVPFDFVGDREKFKPGKKELFGGRIGFGKEFYMGANLFSSTKVEGFYVGTLFSQVLNGGPEDEDVDFAFSKQTGQVFGLEVSQAFGLIYDMKTKNPFMEEWAYLTVEPFVEAGIGKAWAYNRVNYQYDTGTSPTSAREAYRLRVRDDLLNARLGVGVNMTSSSGYFFYLKTSVNNFDIIKRKSEGFSQPNGSGTTSLDSDEKSVKIDPVVIYALGGGYKF